MLQPTGTGDNLSNIGVGFRVLADIKDVAKFATFKLAKLEKVLRRIDFTRFYPGYQVGVEFQVSVLIK